MGPQIILILMLKRFELQSIMIVAGMHWCWWKVFELLVVATEPLASSVLLIIDVNIFVKQKLYPNTSQPCSGTNNSGMCGMQSVLHIYISWWLHVWSFNLISLEMSMKITTHTTNILCRQQEFILAIYSN